MYQAITTKYLPATNVRGSRVKATAAAGSFTMPWDDALNSERNHKLAAFTLAARLKWDGRWHGGAQHNTSGYVFVLEDPVGSAFAIAKVQS